MSKLDLLVEAERRGILPDDKKELLEEARRRGLVPGGDASPGNYKQGIEQEAARRQKAGGLDAVSPTTATVVDTLSLGAHPQITAAGRVGMRKLGSVFTGENVDFPEEYGKERDVIRAQINQKNEEMGTAATLPLNLLGGLAAGPARGVAAAAEQLPNAISYGRSLWNASKVTGALSAAHGFNVETGDYGDKIVSGLEEGAGGMVMGPVIKGGLDLGGKAIGGVRNALAARKTARADRANAVAEDFAATGTPEFSPVLGGPVAQGTASGLAGSVVGGPIRAGAKTSIDALERNIQNRITGAGGGGTPADVGEQAQNFVRRNVVERTPGADVENMNAVDLHRLSGVPPGPNVEVPPPRVPPVQPRNVGRVSAEDVVQEAVANTPPVPPKPVTDLESRYKAPTPEEIELAPEMVKKVQKTDAAVTDLQRQLQARTEHRDEVEGKLLEELKAAGFGNVNILGNHYHFPKNDGRLGIAIDGDGRVHPKTPATPEQEELLKRATAYLQNHQAPTNEGISKLQTKLEQAQREHEVTQREMEIFRANELPKLAAQRRQEALTEATKQNEAEASVATQKARQGAGERAQIDSVNEAMRRTEAAQRAETERAANATAERQRAANAAHATDLEAARGDLGRPIDPMGRTREHPYPTEFDAAYEQVRRNTPDMRVNPLGAKPPVYKAPPVPKPRTVGKYTPAEIEDAAAAWEAVQSAPKMPETLTQWMIRQGGINDTGGEARHIIGGAKGRPGLINLKGGRNLDDLGEAAQQAGFFQERPTVAQLLDHLDNDMRGMNPVVRLQDQEALVALRENRSVESDLERLGVRGAKTAAEVRQTLEAQKQKKAGERAPRQTTAPLRPQDEIHDVADLLDRFASEAGMGKLVGYKRGNLFDESGAVRPEVMDYLRPRLGKEVAEALSYLSERRAGSGMQFGPSIDKLYQLRTKIGQEIRDIEASRRGQGEPRRESDAMLSRLYSALDSDIQNSLRAVPGHAGEVAANQYNQIQQAYERYINDVRKPLAKVFGDKVDPVAALQELVGATQTGSTKSKTLEAFYKVVGDKGDRLQATSWLLNDMSRDGLPAFLERIRSLSPDARRLMAQGEGAPLMEFLDAAARVGGKLERFVKVAGDDYGTDLSKWARPGNVALGSVAYLFGIPGLVAEAVGGAGLSKLLASKWYAGWLKSYPVERQPWSPALASHMNRFYALAAQSLGLNKDAAETLRQSVAPAKANATMVDDTAKGVDHISLKSAKKMEKGKVDRGDIWLNTGWMHDPDGTWRSEISDADAMLTDEAKAAIKQVWEGTAEERKKPIEMKLGEVLKHDALFKARPQFKDTMVIFRPRDVSTARNWGASGDEEIYVTVDNHHGVPSQVLRTIRHELQHREQDEQGMARGGNYNNEATYPEYYRRSREAQARMTEKRGSLTDEQRRARPPWLDYQVPENQIEWTPRKSTARPEAR